MGKTSIFRRFRNGSFAQRRGSTAEEDKHMKIIQVEGKRVAVGSFLSVEIAANSLCF